MHHQEYTVVCFISTLTKTNNFDHFDKDAIGVTKHRAWPRAAELYRAYLLEPKMWLLALLSYPDELFMW